MQEPTFDEALLASYVCDDGLTLLGEEQSTTGLFPGETPDAGYTDVFQNFQGSQKRQSCEISCSSSFPDARARKSGSLGSQDAWLSAETGCHTGQYPISGSPLGQLAPTSVFHTRSQEPLDLPKVRITICQQGFGEAKSADLLHSQRELSNAPSDNLDACHLALRKSSSSPANTQGCANAMSPRQSSPGDSADTGEFPMLRPLVQTGMRSAGGVAPERVAPPSNGGGRRVLRTPEERKAHRMAKNRATAAASRKRKQAMKEDLLQKQDVLELENAQLNDLLEVREQEIGDLRERLAAAEMTSGQTQSFAMLGGPTYMDM